MVEKAKAMSARAAEMIQKVVAARAAMVTHTSARDLRLVTVRARPLAFAESVTTMD
jgi:hypothetical protein